MAEWKDQKIVGKCKCKMGQLLVTVLFRAHDRCTDEVVISSAKTLQCLIPEKHAFPFSTTIPYAPSA